MTDEHTHGPECFEYSVIPLSSPPVLVVVFTEAEGGLDANVGGSLSPARVPTELRRLADALERKLNASLS